MIQMLKCKISKGIFSDEFTISVKTSDGSKQSFFIPKDKVISDSVKVKVIDQQGEYSLVNIPTAQYSLLFVKTEDLWSDG